MATFTYQGREAILKVVKPQGKGGAMIYMPKKYKGENVVVIIGVEEKCLKN